MSLLDAFQRHLQDRDQPVRLFGIEVNSTMILQLLGFLAGKSCDVFVLPTLVPRLHSRRCRCRSRPTANPPRCARRRPTAITTFDRSATNPPPVCTLGGIIEVLSGSVIFGDGGGG